MINLSNGFQERLDLLRHLVLKSQHDKIILQALQLIVDNLIDSPARAKFEELLFTAEVFDARPFTKRARKFLKLLDQYVEYYLTTNELPNTICKQNKLGLNFLLPQRG